MPPPASNNLTTIVIQSETGRTRDEVVNLLRDATNEASKASRAFADLTDKSHKNARAVAEVTKALQDERDKLAAVNKESATTITRRNEIKRSMDETRATINNTKNAFDQLVRSTADTARVTDSAARSMVLQSQRGRDLNRQIQDLTAGYRQLSNERSTLNQKTRQQTQAEIHLTNEIQRLTAALHKEQQAQTASNLSKKEASTVLTKTNADVRTYRKELTDLDKTIRDHTREQERLTTAHVAAANVIANYVTRAFDALWQTIKRVVVDSTIYASRVDELGIALRNVAKITGNTQAAVFGQEAAIKRLGITTEEARQTVLKFAAAQLDIAKSAQLARAAQDLAVIAGADSSETLDRLVHGITTLQIRVLRTAGVYVSLQGAIKSAAAEQNRSMLSFSESEKQQLLLNATLDYAARATGTYEQAMANAGKQMRSMNRFALEAQAAFGKQFQGVFLLIVETLTVLLKAIARAPEAFTVLGVAVTFLVGKLALHVAINSQLGQSFLSLAGSIKVAASAMRDMTSAQSQQMATSQAQTGVNNTSAATVGLGRIAAAGGGGALLGGGAAYAAGAGTGGTIAGAAVGAVGVGAAAALGASIPVLLAVAAAVAALVYVITKYLAVEKELTFAKSEEVEIANRALKVNREDAKMFGEYAVEVQRVGELLGMTAEQRKQYSLALGRLNTSTADAIRQEHDLAKALNLTSEALLKQNEIIEGRRQRMVGADIRGYMANRGVISGRQAIATRAEEIAGQPPTWGIEQARRNIFSLRNFYRLSNEQSSAQLNAAEAQDSLRSAEGDQDLAIQRLTNVYRDMNKHQGTTIEQFLALEPTLKAGTAEYRALSEAILANAAAMEKQQQALRDGTMDLIEFREVYEKALDDMKVANIDVSRSAEGLAKTQRAVLSNLENTIAVLGDYRSAIGVNQQGLRQLDDDLAAASSTQEEYNARIAALDPLLRQGIADAHLQGAKAIERHGEAQAGFARRLDDVNRRLRFTIREIQEINEGMGQAGQLEMLETVVQGVRGRQQQIMDLRVALYGVDAQQGIGGSAEDQESELRFLQGQIDIINAQREQMFRLESAEVELAKEYAKYQQITSDYLNEQVHARELGLMVESRFYQLSSERLTTEKELTAELRAQQSARIAASKQIVGGMDYETRLAILRQLNDQEKKLAETERMAAEARARTAIRTGAYRNLAGLGRLDTPGVELPDPTRPDVIFNKLASTMVSPMMQTAQNTEQTVVAVNNLTDRITGLINKGTSQYRGQPIAAANAQGQAIINAAQTLGVNPADLAGLIGFETGGTYSPSKLGPTTKWGQHFGLIQFGQPQARRYGASRGQSFEDQLMNSVVPYLLDTFKKAGMSTQGANLLQLYSAVIHGNPAGGYDVQDKNRTSARSGAAAIAAQHIPVAMRRFFSTTIPTNPSSPLAQPTVAVVSPEGGVAGAAGYINQQASEQMNALSRRRLFEQFGISMPDPDVVRINSGVAGTPINQLEEAQNGMKNLADIAEDVQQTIDNIGNEFSVWNGLVNSLSNNFEQVRQTAIDLEVMRREDDSGFFESQLYRSKIVMESEMERRRAARETRDEIIRLQDEIANAHIGSENRIIEARLRAEREVAFASENAEIQRQTALVRIADAETVHMDRISSRYTDWVSQQRSLDDIIFDSHTGMLEGVFGVIDSGLDRAVEKMGFAGSVLKNFVSGIVRFYGSRALMNVGASSPANVAEISERGGNVVNVIQGAAGMGRGTQSVRQMFVGQLIVGGSAVGQGMAGSLSGSGGSLPIGGAGANIWSGLASAGSSYGGANGFGVFGSANVPSYGGGNMFQIGQGQFPMGNPVFSPGLFSADRPSPFGSMVNQAFSGQSMLTTAGGISTQSGGALGTALGGFIPGLGGAAARMPGRFGGFFNGGIGAGMASMLPAMGAGLGGMLGGGSGLGGALGQVGGIVGGLAGMSALMSTGALTGMFGGTIGGFLGGAMAIPILAPIAGALLLGAFLIGRNQRRRREEQTRDQAIRNANQALDKLINDVRRDRIDGGAALAQAEEIRSTYVTEMSQLRDRKTRDHALATVREIDARIALLRTAIVQQDRRRAIDDALVPEFAGGGLIQSYAYGGAVYSPSRMGNRVPGLDRGRDTVLAALTPGEVVLNKQQQAMLRPALTMARVPGFGIGGIAPPPVITNNYSMGGMSMSPQFNVYLVPTRAFAEQQMTLGRDKIIELSAADMKDGGLLHGAVRKVKR